MLLTIQADTTLIQTQLLGCFKETVSLPYSQAGYRNTL